MVDVQTLCGSEGFRFITKDGYFLSHCSREVFFSFWPYAIYVGIGWIRFTGLIDAPVWNSLVMKIIWNKRIKWWMKVLVVFRLVLVATCLLFLDLSVVIPDISLPPIVYISEIVRIIAWVFCLVNTWYELSRNKPVWVITKLFWVGSLFSVILREIFFIQSEYFNPKFDIRYIRALFGLIVFVAHVLLIGYAIGGLLLKQLEVYSDPIKEEQVKHKWSSSKVQLKLKDFVRLFLWGWYLLLPGFVFSCVQGTFVMLINLHIGESLEFSEKPTKSSLLKIMTPFFYYVPIAVGSTVIQMTLLGTGSEMVLSKLRTHLFSTFTKQDMTFFNDTGTGYIVSRLTADADIVGNTLRVLSQISEPGVQTFVGFILLVNKSASLGVLVVGMLVFTWVVTTIRSRVVTLRYSARYSDARADCSEKATECIYGFEVIRTYGQDHLELKNFGLLTRIQMKIGSLKEFLEAIFESVELLLNKVIIVSSVYIGALLVIENKMETKDLNSFVFVAITTIDSFYSVIRIAPELWNGMAPLGRIFELMKRKPAQNLDEGEIIPPEQFLGSIEFKNVSFIYPGSDQYVLKNFNLSIAPGERVALIGESGSGKSTILALCLRFYDVTDGQILVDGYDLRTLQPRWWMKQLGLVSQSSMLFKGTIEDNIKYSCINDKSEYQNDEEYNKSMELAHVIPVIDIHDEGDKFNVGQGGNNLSGGQKQRVSIARCIRKNAKLLILDEATSALDANSEKIIMTAIDNLSKGKTTLAVAHRLLTIKNYDKIVVMSKGKILEMGNHDSLIKIPNGGYKRMFEAQQNLNQQLETDSDDDDPPNPILVNLCNLLESNQFYHDTTMKRTVEQIRKTMLGEKNVSKVRKSLNLGAPKKSKTVEEKTPLLSQDESDESDENSV